MNSSIKTIQLIPPSQQSNSSIHSSNQTYGTTRGGRRTSKHMSPKRSNQKKDSTKSMEK